MTDLNLNTHHYDGKIGPIYHQLCNNNQSQIFLTFEQSIETLNCWLKNSKIKDKKLIEKAIHLLCHDHAGNYDPSNNIHVEELLPKVVDIVQQFDTSGIDLFLVNLGEIIELGPCPQGRSSEKRPS